MRAGSLAAVGLAGALAVGLSACGGSSSSSSSSSSSGDPVSTALMTPGVRQVVIPSQHADLTVVIPTCDQAQVLKPGATKPPPGSNTVVVPKGAQTETIAVQPCQGGGGSSGSGSSAPSPPSSTILMTPGGAGTSEQSSGAQSSSSSSSGSSQPNQLVLPNNSAITTLIVPPCTQSSGDSGQKSNKSLALPGKGTSVTAPPCTVPQQSSSS